MKFVLLLIGVYVVHAFGESPSNAIIGGSDATIEEYPYMAGIIHMGMFNCGAAIISARSVLTVCAIKFLARTDYVNFLFTRRRIAS